MKLKSKYCVYDENAIMRFLFLNQKFLLIKVAGIFLLTLGFQIFATIYEKALYIESGRGLLQDFAHPMKLITITIMILLSKKFFDNIPLTFLGSEEALDKAAGLPQAINFDDLGFAEEYEMRIARLLNFIEGKENGRKGVWVVFCICAGVFVLSYIYIPFFSGSSLSWNFSPQLFPISYISCLIQDFVIYILLFPPLLWRIVASVIGCFTTLRDLTRGGKIKYVPMSPDKAGGLKPVGELALSMTYVVASPFIYIIALVFIFGFNLVMMMIFPSYLIAVTIVFFLPLSSAHMAMKLAKESELNKISNEFNRLHGCFYEYLRLGRTDGKESMQISQQLRNLYEMYNYTMQMPVWPLNFGIVARFFSVIIIPLILFILQLIESIGGYIVIIDFLKQMGGVK